MNQEMEDVQVEFRKGKGTRDQIANIHWIIEKATELQKNLRFIDYTKAFWLWITTNSGKFLKRWEYQILPASWETCMQVKNQQNQPWNDKLIQIGNGVHEGCILSPCLFYFHAEYIMGNAGLNESQAGIKISGRSISSLRYADDNYSNGRKQRGTKEPLDEGERGEWKN